MTRQEKFRFFIDYFSAHMPDPETELAFSNPYELLVAVILSAQCTDKRVNLVTPALFKKYPTVKSLANAEQKDLLSLIRSISYPNNKTKHLLGMAAMIESDFGGRIPMQVEDLVKLPGVGRKTAHVITSVVDRQPNLAVDTHVFRVSRRIGLVPQSATTPLAVEKHLVRYLPGELIHKAHHWLIIHGRYTCLARSPKCEGCGLTGICSYYRQLLKSK
jgi:endonuclease-3